jgi:hypothetical protein
MFKSRAAMATGTTPAREMALELELRCALLERGRWYRHAPAAVRSDAEMRIRPCGHVLVAHARHAEMLRVAAGVSRAAALPCHEPSETLDGQVADGSFDAGHLQPVV